MTEPKVSVIIPVYNTEEFLEEAIASIQRQTLQDIEIIIINDGSTDNSWQIIKKLSQKDQRIRLYSQDNQGLSATRNRGIDLALGHYIYFMDSDDFLDPRALERCFNKCISHQLDFVLFDAEVLNEMNSSININLNYNRAQYTKEDTLYKGCELLELLLKTKCYTPSVCLNFINKDYLKQINNLFLPGIIHEDQLFTSILYLEAKRVMCLHKSFFKRRIRPNSIMTQQFSLKNINSYFIISDHLIVYADNHLPIKNIIDEYLFQMLNAVAWLSYQLPWNDRLYVANQYVKKYRQYVSLKNLLILLFKRFIKA